MKTSVSLYSKKNGEIKKFLNAFYDKSINLESNLKWISYFENPVDISDILGVYIENNDKYEINMWISLDKDLYINVTEYNADKIIRYIYERYP